MIAASRSRAFLIMARALPNLFVCGTQMRLFSNRPTPDTSHRDFAFSRFFYWAQIVNGTVLLIGCCLLVSSGIASFSSSNPFVFLGGGLLVSLGVLLGGLQYYSTFRRSANAATAVGAILLAFAAFGIFGVVTNVGEALVKDGWDAAVEFLPVCSALAAALVIYPAFCGWLNLRWGKWLRQSSVAASVQAANNIAGTPLANTQLSCWQFSLKELLGLTAVVACIAGVAVLIARNEFRQQAEDVTAEQCPIRLPRGAEHVSFRQIGKGYFCEFSIAEKGFLDWVGELQASHRRWKDGQLEKIDFPTEVRDYSSRVAGSDSRRTVKKGYSCGWSHNYDHFWVLYDAENQRAYYESFPD